MLWVPRQHMPLSRSRQKVHWQNLNTTELLDCVLIGVCVVIRLNTVSEDTQEISQSQGEPSRDTDRRKDQDPVDGEHILTKQMQHMKPWMHEEKMR